VTAWSDLAIVDVASVQTPIDGLLYVGTEKPILPLVLLLIDPKQRLQNDPQRASNNQKTAGSGDDKQRQERT
jgi:hypothetical protein